MKQLRSKDGDILFKKIKAKIFYPGNHKHVTKDLRAPVGRGINDDGITRWLKQRADAIEKQWPNHEYRMVELAPNSFNFVWNRELSEDEAPQANAEAATA